MKRKQIFLEPSEPFIIIRKLINKIITEAIEAYVENNAYWLKCYHFVGEIDTSILNKL